MYSRRSRFFFSISSGVSGCRFFGFGLGFRFSGDGEGDSSSEADGDPDEEEGGDCCESEHGLADEDADEDAKDGEGAADEEGDDCDFLGGRHSRSLLI